MELRLTLTLTLTLLRVEQELLKRSLDSLDYSGNWSDPARMRDSMVLSCKSPEVRHATLMEYGAAHAKLH